MNKRQSLFIFLLPLIFSISFFLVHLFEEHISLYHTARDNKMPPSYVLHFCHRYIFNIDNPGEPGDLLKEGNCAVKAPIDCYPNGYFLIKLFFLWVRRLDAFLAAPDRQGRHDRRVVRQSG